MGLGFRNSCCVMTEEPSFDRHDSYFFPFYFFDNDSCHLFQFYMVEFPDQYMVHKKRNNIFTLNLRGLQWLDSRFYVRVIEVTCLRSMVDLLRFCSMKGVSERVNTISEVFYMVYGHLFYERSRRWNGGWNVPVTRIEYTGYPWRERVRGVGESDETTRVVVRRPPKIRPRVWWDSRHYYVSILSCRSIGWEKTSKSEPRYS